MARKDFLKVRIRNSGEDDATIVREMTKEEYEFLSDIAQDLNCDGGRVFTNIICRYFRK